ncbi:Putative membrane magnesium transporter [Septoria linicola]|uniref:Membrane magnesium transporter n=1 Tax=Septoria linicola TaxID=215465 RepID=A0A9Q9AEU3_9PEZI|nr:Putative membrane magnesium transporter [Septoria linicola]
MGASAHLVNLAGIVFLTHAVYSSYEHSLLPSSSIPPTPSSILPAALDPKVSIPTDIVLETLFSVLLLCVGVVIGSPDLKPIQWNVWAGRLERSKEAREVTAVGVGGGNPFAVLEERPSFLDVRKTREDFARWHKESSLTDGA